jgi:hypothetical protein
MSLIPSQDVRLFYVAALRRADHSSKESYHLHKKDYETEEDTRANKVP